MHDARLSRSLAQVAAVRRIFTRGKDRQCPEQSRALVTKWIDQYRVADPAPDAAGSGPVLRSPDDA
ncbi:alpha/beta hydrolase fold domain-containing protein, partial [Ralstonia pseudosolanacearum]